MRDSLSGLLRFDADVGSGCGLMALIAPCEVCERVKELLWSSILLAAWLRATVKSLMRSQASQDIVSL